MNNLHRELEKIKIHASLRPTELEKERPDDWLP